MSRPVELTNIAAILSAQAEVQPDALAIIDPRFGKRLTFAQLEEAASRAAALLEQAGLRMGDAALIFQPMSADLYVAIAALFRLGVVAVFLDPSVGWQHIDRCCKLYPPKALIASDKAHLLRLRSPSLRQIPIKVSIGIPVPGAMRWSTLKQMQPHPAIVPCSPETPALLTFTSGSTGQPKAALRTHGFLVAQHAALAKSLHLTPGDIDLATLPIFVLANLASGVTSLIPNVDLRSPGRISGAKLAGQIQIYQPTCTAASPAFLTRLVEYAEQHQIKLTSFKRIFSGGAPVFPRLLQQLQQLAPQAEQVAVYGSTEAEPIAHIAFHQIQPDDAIAMVNGQGLLVGLPVPEIELRILSDRWGKPLDGYTAANFAADCLPIGKVGEIVVSGPHVLGSYLHGQGNEETKFQVEGKPWHRTGDAGYLDAHGRLWLMGRCSARIQDAHGVLYPFTVETAASYQAGIRRTAMVSHQSKRVLVVELNSHAAFDTLDALKQSLAWAAIADFKIYSKIPVDKRHNAKIDYPALHQLLEKR